MRTAELYVIEGPDAVGKATQSALLAEYLETQVVAFPRYETETGKLIEDLLHRRVEAWRTPKGMREEPKSDPKLRDARVLQHAMTWDRYTCRELWDHAGPLVLDRYWMSGWVYGSLDGLDRAELMQAHRGLPVPEHTFILDLPGEEQLRRLAARGRVKDRYEEQAAFLERVRARYLDLAHDESLMLAEPCPLGRAVTVINAEGPTDEVHRRIVNAIINARRVRATLGA